MALLSSDALVLRTLDDALALRERLARRPSVAVVGAGPLGMEVASAAAQAGCEVTVVADTAPMRPQFGPYLSDLFTTAATAAGVKLVHGTATGFAAGTITLDDGSRVTAELKTAHPILAFELNLVQREIQFGHRVGDALRNFGTRCDLEEVRGMAAAVKNAEKFGASMVKTSSTDSGAAP